MRKYKFYHVDVFTERRFGGNPLAVFPEAQGLTDTEMQAIALELNLSETTFVFPAEHPQASHRVRFFTPVRELPFAGHPTIGTHYVLARLNRFDLTHNPTRVYQEVGVGILPVDIYTENGRISYISMTQAGPEFLDFIDDLETLAQGLCCDIDDLDLNFATPQVVSTGLPVMIVPVKNLQVLGNLGLNVAPLREICEKHGCDIAYAFTLETMEKGNSAHARFFSGHLLFEDPATGSAAGALGAFLAKNGIVNDQGLFQYIIEQGDFLGRPGRIKVIIEYQPDRTEVKVSGKCCPVYEAEMILE